MERYVKNDCFFNALFKNRIDFQHASKSSVFTGEEELFAFDRTISRLYEMQKSDYWEQWAKHR